MTYFKTTYRCLSLYFGWTQPKGTGTDSCNGWVRDFEYNGDFSGCIDFNIEISIHSYNE